MTGSSIPSYLYKKKLVIGYIKGIIDKKSRQEYERRRSESLLARSPILRAVIWIVNTIKYKFIKNRRGKYNRKNTLSPTTMSADFLHSMGSFGAEIKEMEEYIDRIIHKSDGDKKILEECENYLSRKHKIHLARMSPIINVLALILFTATIIILVYLLGFFPVSDIKTSIANPNNMDAKIINFLASLIATLTASTVIANALLLLYKPFVEDSHVASTSAYEYCIELLKNARLRVS
jgi:hypothetical protein